MFAGVLDGGRKHHTEEEIYDYLRDGFSVIQVERRHFALYKRVIERPIRGDGKADELIVLARRTYIRPEFRELALETARSAPASSSTSTCCSRMTSGAPSAATRPSRNT